MSYHNRFLAAACLLLFVCLFANPVYAQGDAVATGAAFEDDLPRPDGDEEDLARLQQAFVSVLHDLETLLTNSRSHVIASAGEAQDGTAMVYDLLEGQMGDLEKRTMKVLSDFFAGEATTRDFDSLVEMYNMLSRTWITLVDQLHNRPFAEDNKLIAFIDRCRQASLSMNVLAADVHLVIMRPDQLRFELGRRAASSMAVLLHHDASLSTTADRDAIFHAGEDINDARSGIQEAAVASRPERYAAFTLLGGGALGLVAGILSRVEPAMLPFSAAMGVSVVTAATAIVPKAIRAWRNDPNYATSPQLQRADTILDEASDRLADMKLNGRLSLGLARYFVDVLFTVDDASERFELIRLAAGDDVVQQALLLAWLQSSLMALPGDADEGSHVDKMLTMLENEFRLLEAKHASVPLQWLSQAPRTADMQALKLHEQHLRLVRSNPYLDKAILAGYTDLPGGMNPRTTLPAMNGNLCRLAASLPNSPHTHAFFAQALKCGR